jgi:V8-like Glu-specific endopeptidase
MRFPTVLLCLLVTVPAVLASCGRSGGDPAAAPAPPDPRVGAIFLDGGNVHVCTGSVLHSGSGNLMLTAAHCLLAGFQASFAPGFSGHAEPEDLWQVDDVYLDPRWVAKKDPRADYAIARVSSRDGGSLEAHAGSGLTLGTTPVPGTRVTVTGYSAGTGGSPISCQGTTAMTAGGFPSLVCDGLVGGTSGAPWVNGTTVTAVIGGPEGGGCQADMSYSAPFDEHIAQLLARAEAGGPGDKAPTGYDDGC